MLTLLTHRPDPVPLSRMQSESRSCLFPLVLAVAAGLASGFGVAARAQTPTVEQLREHFARGEEAYRKQRLDDAIREFREAIRLSPTLAEAHAKLGVIYYSRGQYREAADSFREAVRHKPSLTRAQALLGIAAVRSGELLEAVPLLEKSMHQPPDEALGKQSALLLLEAYHKLGRLDQALDIARTLLAEEPGNADLLYSVYRLHSELGSEAVATLTRQAAGSARLHQVTAELLESQGDYVQAVDQYRRAARSDPSLPGIHRALAVALLNASPDDTARGEARKELETEIRANPVDFHSIYELGEIEWSEGRFAEARARFARAVELQPEFVDALIALGKAATRAGDPEGALPHLEKAVRLAPDNEVARYRLSQAYRRQGRAEDARRELTRFEALRRESAAIAEIYRQVVRKPVTGQTVGNE